MPEQRHYIVLTAWAARRVGWCRAGPMRRSSGRAQELVELCHTRVLIHVLGDQLFLVRTRVSMNNDQDFRRCSEHSICGRRQGHLPWMCRQKCLIGLLKRVHQPLHEHDIWTVRCYPLRHESCPLSSYFCR